MGGTARSRFATGRAGLLDPLATGGVLFGARRGEDLREEAFAPDSAAIRTPSAL